MPIAGRRVTKITESARLMRLHPIARCGEEESARGGEAAISVREQRLRRRPCRRCCALRIIEKPFPHPTGASSGVGWGMASLLCPTCGDAMRIIAFITEQVNGANVAQQKTIKLSGKLDIAGNCARYSLLYLIAY